MKKSYFFYAYPEKEDMKLLKKIVLQIRDEKNKISKYIASNRAILEVIYNGSISKFTTKFFTSLRTINDAVAFQNLCIEIVSRYKTIFSSWKYKLKDKSNMNIKKYIFAFKIMSKDNFLSVMDRYLKDEKHDNEFIQKVIDLVQTTNIFEEIQEYIKKKIDYVQKHPITVRSLTFTSINVLQKNTSMLYESHDIKTNACFLLNLPHNGRILLKTRYNKNYHGDLNSYTIAITKSNQHKITYTIKFVNDRKIKLILTKKCDTLKIPTNNKEIVGIDVNTKHNMFAFNDGHIIRYDIDIVHKEKGLRKYLARKAYNKSKHHNKEKHHGKETRKREEKQQRRRKFHQDKKSSLAVKYAKVKGFNHIVMEDLNLQELRGVKLKKNNNLKGMNYNHIKDAIHINDLKNSVQRIAKREKLQFSLVNARFTSKTCPHCGCIDEKNRPNQEHFQCIKCGFTMNADVIAALNIAMRMKISALKKKLQYREGSMYKGKDFKSIEKYIEIYQEVYNNKKIAKKDIEPFLVRNIMENIVSILYRRIDKLKYLSHILGTC